MPLCRPMSYAAAHPATGSVKKVGAKLFFAPTVAEKEGFEPSLRSTRTTPLAGEPLRPLGYFSMPIWWVIPPRAPPAAELWRREWDSNPRRVAPRRFSRPVPSTARTSLRINRLKDDGYFIICKSVCQSIFGAVRKFSGKTCKSLDSCDIITAKEIHIEGVIHDEN